ncbi:hypothetical protein Glove_212g6 [Diversispora epigaea]|uniref:Uncharacterized protein n=1 Tax=Diversispora epigaea TaxID=1348612 RepID=A0A397IL90_9GLOM|nr:hypothetical protein Glove_212g6 [Diversispora epigaea]
MSDLNQLFKRKNQPSLRSNSRPSSSFSSSSSSSHPTLESEDSGLTGLTGSTGLTSRNNDEKMQDDIKSVKEEVAILSYDQDCVYVTEASKISAWKKNPAISNSFRKLFDKVEEDEEDTYMTRIIKNVWPKKKNIPNLQIAWVISIAEIILNLNNENIKISEEIIKPNKIENNESFEYESDSPERLEVAPKRLAAPKKSAVPERPAVPRSNKRITEIETSRKEKKKIRSIRKDDKNDDDDDEADEGDKAYEANETYETDEGDEYYNEIINIDESEEE